MSDRVVADFVARFARNPKRGVNPPDSGRIVMNDEQLVAASDDQRVTVPLSDVVDVTVGNVPADHRELFDDTVTIGYAAGDGVDTLVVEEDSDTIEKFSDVLFKLLLNGAAAVVEHPAKVGGRVTGAPPQPAKLSVDGREVRFRTPDDGFTVDATTVVDFERAEHDFDGDSRPTLAVRHAADELVTSLVAPESSRQLNLLGRYLRIEYDELLSEARDVDLSEAETQVLVGAYTAGGAVDFGSLLDGDAARVTNVLNSLRERDLIEDGDDGVSLTARGRIVVSEYVEQVNA